MTTYFVSRHQASIDWMKQQSIQVDQWLTHLDDETKLKSGDRVIGTLPIQIVERLCKNSVEYIHLSINIPAEWRGLELSPKQLAECSPKLTAYRVQQYSINL